MRMPWKRRRKRRDVSRGFAIGAATTALLATFLAQDIYWGGWVFLMWATAAELADWIVDKVKEEIGDNSQR